jgi:hypothetical protein
MILFAGLSHRGKGDFTFFVDISLPLPFPSATGLAIPAGDGAAVCYTLHGTDFRPQEYFIIETFECQINYANNWSKK